MGKNFNIRITKEVKTKSEAKERFNTYFKTVGMKSNYGLAGALCSKWVRLALNEIGLSYEVNGSINSGGPHAWDLFSVLPFKDLRFIKLKEFNSSNKFSWTNNEIKNSGVKNGSIVFGYFILSKKNKIKSYNSLIDQGEEAKIKKMKEIASKDISGDNSLGATTDKNKVSTGGVTPITHVGIFYNDQLYHLTEDFSNETGTKDFYIVNQNPVPSLQIVSYYPILDIWQKKLPS